MSSFFGKWFKGNTTAAPAPNQFETLFVKARDAAAARDFQRAIELYDRAVTVDGSRADAYYKRGNALKDLGQLSAALASYNQALTLKPDYAYAYCNRGVVQHSLGLLPEALASYDEAIALDAEDAIAHYNRALLMQDCFRWDEALASYNQAIAINPGYADSQYNRSMLLLFLGQFESGWRGFEWRWKNATRLSIGDARNFKEPLWLGEQSIAGKRILLYSEAGLGDTLQFCRYATLSARLGATVLLEVQPPLVALLGDLEGVSQVIAAGNSLPPFDYQCPLMSLPLAFKTSLDAVPASPKYLQGDKAKVAWWNAHLGERNRPRIGLAWSGNPNHTNDLRRSIRLADWVPYLGSEFQYFRLQNHVRETDRAALDSSPIVSFDDDLLDFTNIAALCACMDLVITVDTSLAHLSAALGQRTWVLLPFIPDWRWLFDRDTSPWYPPLKLFRQLAAGDWNEVLTRIAEASRQLLIDSKSEH